MKVNIASFLHFNKILLDDKPNRRENITMISVTRLDGKKYWINPHMIESMEQTPDLTITFLSGKKVVVSESAQEVIDRIVSYRSKLEFSRQDL